MMKPAQKAKRNISINVSVFDNDTKKGPNLPAPIPQIPTISKFEKECASGLNTVLFDMLEG